MASMLEQLADVVKNHLPATVGAELQTVLKKGELDAEQVRTLTGALESTRRERDSSTSRLHDAEAQLKKHAELRAREIVVEEKERNLRIKELELELAAEKRVSGFATDTVLRLVRNVEYRNSTLSQVPVVVPGGASGYSGSMSHTAPFVSSGQATESGTQEAT